METKAEDLFNIKNIVRILMNKNELKEYIFFKVKLPKIEKKNFVIHLKEGLSLPTVFNNYFLNYGLLHEFLQCFLNTEKKTFDFFAKNIFKQKEIEINSLMQKIANSLMIDKKNIITFDFGKKELFLNTNKKFNKGSSIENFSTCYNNFLIYSDLLKVLTVENITKNKYLLIKFPSIINQATNDILKILSYTFDGVTLIKTIEDSYFKDSFHVLCTDVDVGKYNEIKSEIKKESLYSKKNYLLNRVIVREENEEKNVLLFNNELNNFSLTIQVIFFCLLSTFLHLFDKSLKKMYREKLDWESLDYCTSNLQ